MITDSVPAVRVAHHTLSGARHGERPKHSLLTRADAAHLAGIHEIGACAADLGSWDPAALAREVRRHHVTVGELEWLDVGEPDAEAENQLMLLADHLGAKQLNVGVCAPASYPERYLVWQLKRIAILAAAHNLTVAFEPVVFGSVPDYRDVQRIIEQAGEPNVGLLLDTYHMARWNWTGVDDIRADMVVAVQISGLRWVPVCPAWPYGLLQEAQCGRLMPDEGDFPVADWLQSLKDMGVQARLSVEILSDTQRARTVFDAADAVASSAEKFAALWEV